MSPPNYNRQHVLQLCIDCVPYEFAYDGDNHWIAKDFTAFDLKVPERWRDRCVGKTIGDAFLKITHEEDDTLTIGICWYEGSMQDQADLLEQFFSTYFDSLREIGWETLDPCPE